MPLKHSVEEIKLKNGAEGLFISIPGSTSVHYDVLFRAGNHYVRSPEISQTAHIMEHMSFGPNERFATLEEFSQEFSRNGAYSNAHTGSVDMVYTADVALMEWDRILELQRLAITKPKFLQTNLETEKGNVHEELIGYGNDPGRILWQRMMRRAGLDRWYDEDEIKTIPNVTLDDIIEHHTRTHTLKNMRFVFAGDIGEHKEAIIAQLESWELPTGELFPIKQEKYNATGLVHVKRADLPNLSFNLSFFLNRTLDRRELRAMNVLCHILTDTMHSRIWGVARTRGICYGMGSWVQRQPSGISEFGVGGQVSFDNAKELFELIIEQLQLVVKEGVTQEELDKSKENRLGGLQLGTETVRSLVGWYSDMYYDYGEIDYYDNMVNLVLATTCEEIQKLAEEFISSPLWSFGAVGNIDEEPLTEHYQRFAKAFGKE